MGPVVRLLRNGAVDRLAVLVGRHRSRCRTLRRSTRYLDQQFDGGMPARRRCVFVVLVHSHAACGVDAARSKTMSSMVMLCLSSPQILMTTVLSTARGLILQASRPEYGSRPPAVRCRGDRDDQQFQQGRDCSKACGFLGMSLRFESTPQPDNSSGG